MNESKRLTCVGFFLVFVRSPGPSQFLYRVISHTSVPPTEIIGGRKWFILTAGDSNALPSHSQGTVHLVPFLTSTADSRIRRYSHLKQRDFVVGARRRVLQVSNNWKINKICVRDSAGAWKIHISNANSPVPYHHVATSGSGWRVRRQRTH